MIWSDEGGRLVCTVDGERAGWVSFVEVAPDQCHVLAVTVLPAYQRRGIATEGIEILMTRYRFFSAEPRNDRINQLFAKLAERDDVTAWPRVARWRHGRLHYV